MARRPGELKLFPKSQSNDLLHWIERGQYFAGIMVRHILLLQPKAGVASSQIEEARESLAGLVGEIHGLLDFHWGENFASIERQDGYAFGFTMDFLDRQALDAYGPHPEHQKAAAKVREAFDRIAVLDFEI